MQTQEGRLESDTNRVPKSRMDGSGSGSGSQSQSTSTHRTLDLKPLLSQEVMGGGGSSFRSHFQSKKT
ncbi:hypothetical protein D8674_024446 [Pyrus ussuriensis x Pyrus communis]|uniref:Uncharacterized protein n=1 Tax=Pyrus ussuriensis x Pyrus communis TaxID=2448454 RepID=A0A5N5HGG7_9ROSA|nr:hypothetical protein D8674_024446 [Pyrus ussuriensis x Pyrus communis]